VIQFSYRYANQGHEIQRISHSESDVHHIVSNLEDRKLKVKLMKIMLQTRMSKEKLVTIFEILNNISERIGYAVKLH
jgi:hypothetical protein